MYGRETFSIFYPITIRFFNFLSENFDFFHINIGRSVVGVDNIYDIILSIIIYSIIFSIFRFWIYSTFLGRKILDFIDQTIVPQLRKTGFPLLNLEFRKKLRRNIINNSFLQELRKKINFGDHINVKINLGQDDLKELDVLRYIAKGTHINYHNWYHNYILSKRLGWILLYYLMIFVITGLIYYYRPIYNYVNDLRYETNFIQYFPSQAIFLSSESISETNDQIIFEQDANTTIYLDNINGHLSKYPDFKHTDTIIQILPLEWTPAAKKSSKDIISKIDSSNYNVEKVILSNTLRKFTVPFDYFTNVLYKRGKNILGIKIQSLPSNNIISNQISSTDTLLVELKDLKGDSILIKEVIKSTKDSLAIIRFKYERTTSHKDRTSEFLIYEDSFPKTTDSLKITVSRRMPAKKGSSKVRIDTLMQSTIIRDVPYLKIVGSKNYPDSFVQKLFHKGQNHLDEDFSLLPAQLDYFFILFFLFVLLIKNIIFYRPVFGTPSHKYILRRLNRLVENIEANISRESVGNVMMAPTARLPLLGFRTKKHYPILGAKAIESELITILNEIDRLPKLVVQPKFNFIFDELDKIEPNYKTSIADKEEETPIEEGLRTDTSRRRQEVITKLLADLKHFLNTAKGKFIFIAGREMYDASLADISDRESSIGSIFHDVLYVNSFFTDPSDGKVTDLTSMAELYLCQFLLPNKWQYELSLKGYHEYLKQKVFPNPQDNKKRIKIIFTLYNFVTFLAYRSGGAPKRLTHLLEQKIRSVTREELKDENNLICGKNYNNLYLHFDYDSQYEYGFTAYLFTPFLNSLSHYFDEYGDKLLVSTFYLMDHLYKFHNFGFSWRNLELIPEIISINKSPQLRPFIENIIQFLSKTHIRQIFSGLYEFRFNQKINAEIQYLSKISESSSAAFNFTLDESLQIKRYYNKRLRYLQNTYNKSQIKSDTFIHSVAMIHMSLGDLHFYDQELNDAIIHYMDAIQILRETPGKSLNMYNAILLIRNMLKLGLVFERRKTFDSAFMTYGKLTSLVLDVRSIEQEELGLNRFVVKENEKSNFFKEFKEDIRLYWYKKTGNRLGNRELRIEFNRELDEKFAEHIEILVLGRPKPKTNFKHTFNENEVISERSKSNVLFPSFQSMATFYDFADGETIISKLESLELLTNKEEYILKTSIFEGMRLIYQPLIARLHLIEKDGQSKLTQIDIDRNNIEFDFLTRTINRKEKFFMETEFFNKVGDLLYYKNGYLPGTRYILINGESQLFTETEAKIFLRELGINNIKKDYRAPFNAFNTYLKSLYVLYLRVIEYDNSISAKSLNFLKEGGGEEAKKILHQITQGLLKLLSNDDLKYNTKSKVFYTATANSLIDVADTLLCFSDEKEEIRELFLTNLVTKLIPNSNNPNVKHIFGRVELNCIEQSLLLYAIGAIMYAKVGEFRLYISQLTKILQVLRNYEFHNNIDRKNLIKNNISSLQKEIVNRTLRAHYRAYENTNRPEIDKLRHIFNLERKYPNESISTTQKDDLKAIYNNLTISAGLRETILLWAIIKLQYNISTATEIDINPFLGINNKYSRILEMQYKVLLNYTVYTNNSQNNSILDKMNIIKSELSSIFNFSMTLENNELDSIINLIADTIFCLFELIQCYGIFDKNYAVANNLSLAWANEKMGWWCEQLLILQTYLNNHNKKENERLNSILRELLTDHDLNNLSYKYYYEMANKYYRDVLSMHTEGEIYDKMIGSHFYLQDDFNDSLLHFSMAIERYKLNCGIVRKKIYDNKEKISITLVYDYENYIL